MERRRFLATAAATTAGLSTAGCSGLGGPVDLYDPEVGTQADGEQQYLTYRHDGTDVVTIGIDQREEIRSPTDRFKMRFSVPHSDGTTIESVLFDLRAPPASTDPPAEIYLKAPGPGWPAATFERVESRWTRFGFGDPGELGEGTMIFEVIVDPLGTPAEEVGIRADIELSSDGLVGPSYRVDDRIRFEPVVG